MTYYRQDPPFGDVEPIAIVGVGCTLPGNISNTQDLLKALRAGRDLITDVPPDRWNADAFYDPDPLAPGKTYVRKGGFVEDIDRFDAAFFGISDAEAARMDPQQRMILQTVWHALENAGQPAEELMHSNTGVFMAMMNTNNYSQLKSVYEGLAGITAYDAMGDAMSIAAGRIAHFLGLEGPCLTLDTACSSSLVALHLARQSILAGDCDMAIVAGVNAILHPGIHIAFSKVGLMSRLGRSAAFDASADGYIRGEGCMAVVLRRRSQAIAHGDSILASIVGTAINQDGRTPAVTAPNGRSQEKVIRSALARTGVNPNDIGYVEAHGTGTPVGDPIEMSAIANVYGPGRSADETLYVGSVKSNFGHIEAGAGLLGLVKAALSLQHEEIFPTVHFAQELNPNIDLGHAPIQVATQVTPWHRNGKPRLAGVNSFGYSGTNAHAILQEAPQIQDNSLSDELKTNSIDAPSTQASLVERTGNLVLISAKSAGSLEEMADKWLDYLDLDAKSEEAAPLSTPSASLRDIAFTAALGRTHLSHRLAIIANGKDDLGQKLSSWREGRMPIGLAAGQVLFKSKPKVAFMFTGQGAQYAGMGRELYQSEFRFAQAIDQVAEIIGPSALGPESGVPLLEVLFGEKSAEYLENTRYVQPALFAIEYALAELLRLSGIEPDYVIGHSIGEITAACIAGMLSLEDAARFVVERGRLMGSLPPGGKMLAISASLEQVQQWVQGREDQISIATVNGPQAVVVSGTAQAVMEVGELAQAAGRRTKELEVSHAFHSPLMDPILADLTRAASTMRIAPARIPILSNTTGDFFSDDIDPSYWSTQVRQAVLFHKGVERIIDARCSLLLEIGPHPSLIPAVATAFDMPALQTVPTLKRDGKDSANLLNNLAALYTTGLPLKLEQLYWNPEYHRVTLPLYPFRRDRHWLVSNGTLDETHIAEPELPELPELHPLLGQATVYTSRKAVFETTLSTTSPWTDHRVLGTTVFPGTAYLEMAARGFAAVSGQDWRSVVLKEVVFERPLLLVYGKPKKVSLELDHATNGKGGSKFIIAASDDPATVYCRGHVYPTSEKLEQVEMEEFRQREADMKIGPFYGELRKGGLEYGARFANVRELWLGKPGSGEAVGRVANVPILNGKTYDPYLNAVLLDGCLHVFGAALGTYTEGSLLEGGAFVPAKIQSITLRGQLPAQVWSQVKVQTNGNGRAAHANIRVLNDAGEVLVEFEDLELRHTLGLSADKLSQAGGNGNGNGKISSSLPSRSREQLVEFLHPLSKKERIAELSKWLAGEIKDTMGQAAEGLNIDKLPASTVFLEIGLDSLLVTELQRRIQEKLDFRFKPQQGLDYQSIETLAEYIHDEVLSIDQKAEVSR